MCMAVSASCTVRASTACHVAAVGTRGPSKNNAVCAFYKLTQSVCASQSTHTQHANNHEKQTSRAYATTGCAVPELFGQSGGCCTCARCKVNQTAGGAVDGAFTSARMFTNQDPTTGHVHIASCWVSTTQVASLFCIRERGGEFLSALPSCQGLDKQGWQAKAKAKAKAGAGRQTVLLADLAAAAAATSAATVWP